MQFTTILALFCAVAIAAPIMPTQADVELVARQSGSNSDGNPLAGLLNGGQQSDSDGEGNAVSTSECGLLACTSGSAASAESKGNTTSSSSTSATDYNISIL